MLVRMMLLFYQGGQERPHWRSDTVGEYLEVVPNPALFDNSHTQPSGEPSNFTICEVFLNFISSPDYQHPGSGP